MSPTNVYLPDYRCHIPTLKRIAIKTCIDDIDMHVTNILPVSEQFIHIAESIEWLRRLCHEFLECSAPVLIAMIEWKPFEAECREQNPVGPHVGFVATIPPSP